jgi:peptidoglycan hydrolase-like protein with peptidoglycan-binding domain
MKNKIQTLALSSALVAFTIGIAAAQGSTPTTTTTTTPTATTTTTKSDMKPAAAKTEKATKAMKAPKWTEDQIEAAQKALAKGGYYKGESTGKWNGATSKALKAWQKANKMKATGKLTDEILTKLQAS